MNLCCRAKKEQELIRRIADRVNRTVQPRKILVQLSTCHYSESNIIAEFVMVPIVLWSCIKFILNYLHNSKLICTYLEKDIIG